MKRITILSPIVFALIVIASGSEAIQGGLSRHWIAAAPSVPRNDGYDFYHL